MSLCNVIDCVKNAKAKGMCMSHYHRNLRYGDPMAGRKSPSPKGSGSTSCGYPMMAHKLVHVSIVEKVLGKNMPKGCEIHHVNKVRDDNRNENLVVCKDSSYHRLLHYRSDAFDACGNANARRCNVCGKFDVVTNMKKHSTRNIFFHTACRNEYERTRASMKKEQLA